MTNNAPSLRGLRHLALRVRNLTKAKDFYVKFFGMKVVWEPDEQNCYLSSGADNLALHAAGDDSPEAKKYGPLDHFGFIAETPAAVDDWAGWAAQNGAQIVTPPRQHRDGSYSCYLVDPDGNSIQVLYEPRISRI
jgi:catechol 2,3-dioxygenase-like lactoylglutathione lyase family enzyme